MQMSVLRLTLSFGALSTVKVTLLADELGDADDGHLWLRPEDFGIPESVAGLAVRDEQFTLPTALIELLHRVLDQPGSPETLWVQLVEPFGYLGFVPWERLIEAHFSVAVVRLPTLTLSRRRPTNSLQVAILAPVPDPRRHGTTRTRIHAARLATESAFKFMSDDRLSPEDEVVPTGIVEGIESPSSEFSATELDRVVRAVLRGSPRKTTTIHVVTTPWIYHGLKSMWRGRTWPVRLHDPYALVNTLQQLRLRKRPVEASWLRLLHVAQGGEQADVVHLVCHGSVTDTKTRLVFSDPLHSSANAASRYVSLPALMSALDKIGAWSLCLTSPSGSATPHLRYIACRLAELRPGPLLVTDLATDHVGRDITTGYKFLYASTPSPAPRMYTGMIACEPHRVSDQVPEVSIITRQVESAPDEQPRDEVAALIADDATPIWLAAAQRFIEQRQVDMEKLKRDAPIGALSPEATYVTDGIKRALVIIQDALVAHVRQTRDR